MAVCDHASSNSHRGHGGSVPVRVSRVILANVIIALAFPALILSLACLSQCDTWAESNLLRVINQSCLCAMHAWHVAPPTLRPTKGLLFIMPAQQLCCLQPVGPVPARHHHSCTVQHCSWHGHRWIWGLGHSSWKLGVGWTAKNAY